MNSSTRCSKTATVWWPSRLVDDPDETSRSTLIYVAYIITTDYIAAFVICTVYMPCVLRKKKNKMDHSPETVYVLAFHAWNYQVEFDVLEFRRYRIKPVTIVSPVHPIFQRGVIVMLVIFKLPPLRSCYTNTVMQVKPIVVTTLHRLGRLVVNHFSFCIVKYTVRRKVAYLT